MLTLTVTYDPSTRLLSFEGERFLGTTEDNASAQIVVNGISDLSVQYTAELVFGVSLYNDGMIYHPIGTIDISTSSYILPNEILAKAVDGILPTELRLTNGTEVIVSRNRLDIEVSQAIDALGPISGAYRPDIYGKTSQWASDVLYAEGAVVIHNGVLFYSIRSDNLDHVPTSTIATWWRKVETFASNEYETIIGDGSSTAFAISHNLHTLNIWISARDPNFMDMADLITDVTVTDRDTLSIEFASAPQIGTRVRVSESYNVLKGDAYITDRAHVGNLTVGNSVIALSTGNIGVDPTGRAVAGTVGNEKVLTMKEELDAYILSAQVEFNNKIDKNTPILAGTYPKVTVDSDGLVTGGSSLAATDIPILDAAKITTGTFDVARIPVKKYTGVITGNGSAKTFTLAHGLGGAPLSVMLHRADGQMVDTKMVLSATNITVYMTTAPSIGENFTVTAIRW